MLLMVPSHLYQAMGVVQATPSLTLTDVLYVLKFPVSLLSISSLSNIIIAR